MDCFILNKNGFIVGRGEISKKEYNKKVHLEYDENIPYHKFINIKWDFKKKSWVEGSTPEDYLNNLNLIKQNLKSENRFEVRTLCLEIAEEIEQTNWLNFPEDYEPEDIEEKKNQIKEIRAKGREIRAKIDASESLEELNELDLNMVDPPEPEVSEETSEEEPKVYENLEELYDEKLQENPEVVEDQPEDTGE